MKYKTFEDFLKVKFAELNPQVLDDDMPDAYDNWLFNVVDKCYIIKYADEYAAIQKQEIVGWIEKMKCKDKCHTNRDDMVVIAMKTRNLVLDEVLNHLNQPLTQ